MKLGILAGIILLLCNTLLAQTFFQGYTEELSGKRFGYHSPFPEVNTSLLLRGQADYEAIAWKAEAVPAGYKDKYVTYIWLYGMDVTSTPVDFTLSVNGMPWFDFQSSKSSDLGLKTYQGKDGAELTFNVTMLDKYEDQMGFAILKIPVSAIEPGKAATITISTATNNNNAWFMTFKTAVEDKVDIYQNQVVAKKDGKLYHTISVDFIHVGADAAASISIGDLHKEITLRPGFNKQEIYLHQTEETRTHLAVIRIAGKEEQIIEFTLSPVKHWEILLVQHTHTDIGYTRPQTEILPEHLRYIDHALDYCDQTDDYPDDAKFRWTCETSWSVREYLRSRPQEQIDRLLQRVLEGRIEVTGMFLNFSEIADESALAAQTKTLQMIENQGIDVTTAMQNDVNGIAWCLVDYYNNTNVKYLTMGLHAHRARKPFDKPTSFWWQSPAGNRLLAYRSEHYQHGNSLSLTTGQMDVLRNNLSLYLKGLEEKGYPYDKISLQFSGYITDNSPPSIKACDIIREWNEKYEWPKLRSALAREFMIYLDEQHAEDIPEQEVAWPDWWTDGVASAANETKVVRTTQSEMSAITTLLSMAKILGVKLPADINDDIEEVYDDLLFYVEHTHGAAESVTDPLAQNTINQWGMKSAYAWEAAKQAHFILEKALAFIEPKLGRSGQPTIAVFNTLNWERSGLVEMFIPFEAMPEGVEINISDAEGNNIPFQQYERRQEGAYYGLWVEDIPAVGYKILSIGKGIEDESKATKEIDVLENQYYRLSMNEAQGHLTQLYDKELGIDLIDPTDSLSLGMVIYEELSNRHELERLTNTNRDTTYKPLNLQRTELSNIKVTRKESGDIYNSIFLNGDLPVCTDDRGVSIEVRLYHHQKKIEFHYSMFKLPVLSPEAVYVAFPFKLDNGKLCYEAQGGIVYPGVNQLEGTSSDWNAIQNFAAVRNDASQIVFVSDEIPLLQFGDINIGRYYYRLKPKSNHIFSWVLNNYWVTNFKAQQEGELRWTYAITSSENNSDIFATRFGWGERVPLLSRVMLPSQAVEESMPDIRTILNIDVPNLLLVNATPSMDGTGIILHLREIEGDHAILYINRLKQETGATSVSEVNVLEEELQVLTAPLLIEHYETSFVKLSFE
jgi:hypothetical protein